MIRIKRVYDKPARADGYRILIDRLWPRGIKKAELPIYAWAKELAPSGALRQAFAHDPERWTRFRSDYRAELQSTDARKRLRSITNLARKHRVTLLYSARDERHNNAVVLETIIRRALTRCNSSLPRRKDRAEKGGRTA